jgi:chromosome segregation protein
MVKEMTDKSQFVIITHSKITMEGSDSLYGVTMQEPGVSKMISVNLVNSRTKSTNDPSENSSAAV